MRARQRPVGRVGPPLRLYVREPVRELAVERVAHGSAPGLDGHERDWLAVTMARDGHQQVLCRTEPSCKSRLQSQRVYSDPARYGGN